MDDRQRSIREITRRHFFRRSGVGLGSIALASMMDEDLRTFGSGGAAPLAEPRLPRFQPRIKNVIFLFMCGGPSQVDLLDPKPILKKRHGQPVPAELVAGERFAFITGRPKLLGSPYGFRRHGESGLEVSSLMPNLAAIADDIAVVRSLQYQRVQSRSSANLHERR